MNQFLSDSNITQLSRAIVERYDGDWQVTRFLDGNIDNLINKYASHITNTNVSVGTLNTGFIDWMVKCINLNVRSAVNATKKTDDILQSWQNKSARAAQYRDDPQFDLHGCGGKNESDAAVATNMYLNEYMPKQYDQAVSYHAYNYDSYDLGDQLVRANAHMNRTTNGKSTPLYNGEPGFGREGKINDDVILQRRFFRDNQLGVENGVNMREARLNHRHIDRETDTTLGGFEYEHKVYKHDMSQFNNYFKSKYGY